MDEVQNGELETVSEQIKEQEAQVDEGQAQSVVDETIPAKYRGKTVKQLAEELEVTNKNLGRYTNELGELRKLSDELIKSQLQKTNKQDVVEEVDIFENPKEAIRRAIETNPDVMAAKHMSEQARQEMARQKLMQMHPDALELAQDDGFNAWVEKSSIRKELLGKAHQSFDINAADELFSTYKEIRAAKKASTSSVVSDAEVAARKKTVASAGVDSGGTGERSKKIYRRSDILNIMAFDKRKYESMADEITLAYAEGRVR